MPTTIEDVLADQAIEELHEEAVMKAATLEQCIYLFVEGESEEKAFPVLLSEADINFEEIGLVLANYNGIGNFLHALRLMSKTLSHNRPIIVTYDNDEIGQNKISEYNNSDYKKNDTIFLFPIPEKGIVNFPNGHVGGSFEEMFCVDHFIACCFNEKIMDSNLIARRSEFDSTFDTAKPWFSQVRAFCAQKGDTDFASKKSILVELLLDTFTKVPDTIVSLANLIMRVRDKYPVKHPLDVELPMIPGLTKRVENKT